MGVRGLFYYTKIYQKPIENENHLGKQLRIGIDTLCLLYRFHGDIEKIFTFLKPILHHKLLFVFDGKAPDTKIEEVQKRKDSVNALQEKIIILKEWLKSDISDEIKKSLKKRIEKLEYDSWTVTYEIRQEFKNYLKENSYAFVKSNQEADAVLIDLYYAKYIDIVLSQDMDFLIAGVERLWTISNNSLKEIQLKEILDCEEINKEQFKEVAILSGIDNIKICTIDDVTDAIQLIRHYGSIESIIIHKENYIELPNVNYVRDIKKRFYPNRQEPLKNVKDEHIVFLQPFLEMV